jgi:hypothetical protein
MLEAIAILLQFIDTFIGIKQNAKDTPKSEVAKWAYKLYLGLGKISSIVDDMLEVLEDFKDKENKSSQMFKYNSELDILMDVKEIDYRSRYALVDFLSLNEDGLKYVVDKNKKIPLMKLLQLYLATHIQEFCQEVQGLIFFIYPEGFEKFYRKNYYLLSRLQVFDENLHNDVHEALLTDFAFLDLMTKLGFQFDQKNNKIFVAKTKFELNRETEEFGFYFEKETTEYSLDKIDDVEKILDVLHNLHSAINSALESVRNFLKNNYTIEDVI